MDFKVGDKVRVIKNLSDNSNYLVGKVDVVGEVNKDFCNGVAAYYLPNIKDGTWWKIEELEKVEENVFPSEYVQRDEVTIDTLGVMIKETPSIDVELKISDIVKEERYYIETNLGRFDVTDQVKNILHMEGK